MAILPYQKDTYMYAYYNMDGDPHHLCKWNAIDTYILRMSPSHDVTCLD